MKVWKIHKMSSYWKPILISHPHKKLSPAQHLNVGQTQNKDCAKFKHIFQIINLWIWQSTEANQQFDNLNIYVANWIFICKTRFCLHINTSCKNFQRKLLKTSCNGSWFHVFCPLVLEPIAPDRDSDHITDTLNAIK